MGNCLDRTLSSSSSSLEDVEINAHPSSYSHSQSGSDSRRRYLNHQTHSLNRYIHLNESNGSLDLPHHLQNHSASFASNLSTSLPNNNNTISSLNNFFSTSAAAAAAAATSPSPSSSQQPTQSSQGSGSQMYYVSPNQQRTAEQMTEEEQIKLLKRMTLIQQLPTGSYDQNKKNKECVICMIDFEQNDIIKYLPCMHTFHQNCIDTWLVRSLICPSCMEPVDAGLLSAFE